MLDAPTLFESGIDFICDGVISVVCDREKSIERIMARDNITREMAQSRLSSQYDKDYYVKKSLYAIENNGPPQEIIKASENIAVQIIRGI